MSARRATAPAWLRALALLVLCASASAAQAQARLQASDVEAAYLVNFLRYTQWPELSFATPQSPYVLTVVGAEPVAASVRAVAQAAGVVNGRSIEVRWIADAEFQERRDAARRQQVDDRLRSSHLVFFHASAGSVRDAELAPLAGQPVLTVGDQAGFNAAGGMIELVSVAGRIVFQANPAAIRNAGLVVSAKVLKLARAVEAGT